MVLFYTDVSFSGPPGYVFGAEFDVHEFFHHVLHKLDLDARYVTRLCTICYKYSFTFVSVATAWSLCVFYTVCCLQLVQHYCYWMTLPLALSIF